MIVCNAHLSQHREVRGQLELQSSIPALDSVGFSATHKCLYKFVRVLLPHSPTKCSVLWGWWPGCSQASAPLPSGSSSDGRKHSKIKIGTTFKTFKTALIEISAVFSYPQPLSSISIFTHFTKYFSIKLRRSAQTCCMQLQVIPRICNVNVK